MTVQVRAPKFYAGIGSRKAPEDILITCQALGYILACYDWTLRSGHADGCDNAFERGCDQAYGKKEIYLPWHGFNKCKSYGIEFVAGDWQGALTIAKKVHPAWKKLKQSHTRLHGRNVYQVLGKQIDTPADYVICWTENGELKGGTATAIRIALDRGIPIINLGDPKYSKATLLDICLEIGLDKQEPLYGPAHETFI